MSRYNLLKRHSTKPERVVYELLKELKIPFKHRWLIEGREVDFLIGKHVIEIDGHPQVGEKNHRLADKGYVPIHFSNQEILTNRNNIKSILKEIYGFY